MLCLSERHLMLISLWGQAVYPLWWPSLTKDMQTEQLCWSDVADTEHCTTGLSELMLIFS